MPKAAKQKYELFIIKNIVLYSIFEAEQFQE